MARVQGAVHRGKGRSCSYSKKEGELFHVKSSELLSIIVIAVIGYYACNFVILNVSLKKVFSRSVLCQFWQKTAQTNSLCYNNTAFLAMKSA